MKDDFRFLSVDDVIFIHEDTVAVEGGGEGIRDLGLLEAAVMMARQQFGGEYLHPTLSDMAGAYLFHICKNHPFVDGNKRCAAMSALVFLTINGSKRLPAPSDLERVTLAVASSEMNKDALLAWLRSELD